MVTWKQLQVFVMCVSMLHVDEFIGRMHSFQMDFLTNKQLEMRRCILSNMTTDAMVLKHQAINVYNAE